MSDSPIRYWKLSFSLENNITNIWNAINVSTQYGNYELIGSDNHESLNAGETLDIGFEVNQGSSEIVPIGFKLVQPSQIGITDMDTSSPGDPGVSGMMCPMCNINEDGSFVEYEEPNSWRDDFAEMRENFNNLLGMQETIEFKKKLHMTYDDIKEDMIQETLTSYQKLMCPVYDRNGVIDYSIPPISIFDDITIGSDPEYGEFVQLNFTIQ